MEDSGAGDKPASGATVPRLPADGAQTFEATTKSGEADAAGTISFKDVPPGKYLVFAWEKVEDGEWFDATFLKPFESQAASVTIQPGGHERADVRLIPESR